jgi:hypothetical protein
MQKYISTIFPNYKSSVPYENSKTVKERKQKSLIIPSTIVNLFVDLFFIKLQLYKLPFL